MTGAPEETEVVIERDFLLTLVDRVGEHAFVLSPAWTQVLKKEFPNSNLFFAPKPLKFPDLALSLALVGDEC